MKVKGELGEVEQKKQAAQLEEQISKESDAEKQQELKAKRSALLAASYLVDDLHAPLDLAPYRALFQMPRAFGFLTPEEHDLVQGRFHNAHIPHEVLGIGLDAMPKSDRASRPC